jgi:hypothetical protein
VATCDYLPGNFIRRHLAERTLEPRRNRLISASG